MVWVGAGVRIAQSLGMHAGDKQPPTFVPAHLLNIAADSRTNRFPNDTFPLQGEQLAFFRKEIGARLWWFLCAYDWDVSYRTRNVSVLRAQDCSSLSPSR